MNYSKKVLFLIFCISLFNYIDRQVLYAVFPLIKTDLNLSDTQLGLLASAFMVIYTVISPIMGFIGDKVKRPFIIGGSVIFWSFATITSGLSRTFGQLGFSRGLVGVGEAGYGSVCPSYLAEWFRPELRARIMSLYALAIPVGSAIGYLLGGYFGHKYGWREAFYIVAVPGILLGFIALSLKETPQRENRTPASFSEYKKLFKNRTYLLIAFSKAIGTFSVGGLAAWMPTYYVRNWDLTVAEAGFKFGLITVAAGILGNVAGGFLADWFRKYNKRSYFIVGYMSFFLSVPFAVLSLDASTLNASLAYVFVCEFFIFMHSGPYHAAIVEVTPVNIRSMAFALDIFIIHAFGDAVSPLIVGYVSDKHGLVIAIFFAAIYLLGGGITSILAGHFYKKDHAKEGKLED
ncbi:MAG: MFS transporter [Elusimicrobia bacterium CG08_land_8_20_14_0_20_51_18]|nr:MAG: MFS transporter [Elusimicrobia bacterium CG08_land_8_20_14_0_20_51_18]